MAVRAHFHQCAIRAVEIDALEICLGHPVCGSRTDGACATDYHGLDGIGRFAVIIQPQELKLMREQWLVDHYYVATVHPHGPIISAPDFHKRQNSNRSVLVPTSVQKTYIKKVEKVNRICLTY